MRVVFKTPLIEMITQQKPLPGEGVSGTSPNWEAKESISSVICRGVNTFSIPKYNTLIQIPITI